MRRYAQMLYGEVIFIYETERTMQELNQIFDPSTFWIDITDTPDVKVGYVQGIQEDRMILVDKTSPYSIQNLKLVLGANLEWANG